MNRDFRFDFAPPEKPRTGKLLFFRDFHRYLCGRHVLAGVIALLTVVAQVL
jgi:hypothetical protein